LGHADDIIVIEDNAGIIRVSGNNTGDIIVYSEDNVGILRVVGDSIDDIIVWFYSKWGFCW
jgi:hypothetical protein